MKTFTEWEATTEGYSDSEKNLMELAWNASAENSAEEIAKLDARIEELEADQTKAQAAVKIGNYIGKNYLIAWCDNVLADQVTDLLQKQAAEISRLTEVSRTKHLEAIDWAGKHQEATEQISRLKGVIAKCDVALTFVKKYVACAGDGLVNEAIAAIKEIEHD